MEKLYIEIHYPIFTSRISPLKEVIYMWDKVIVAVAIAVVTVATEVAKDIIENK